MLRPVLAIILAAWLLSAEAPGAGDSWTLQLDLKGKRVEGMPVNWSAGRVRLLGRDGHLWDFPASEAKNFRKKASTFQPYSQGELRSHLLREFGQGYEVTGTGHYLVVHPAGEGQRWASWFEDLHRSMVHYFTARGFPLQKTRFPLVAVVFPNQKDFIRYAAQGGHGVGTSVLGYYDPTTNRIAQFESGGGQPDQAGASGTIDTIIHESAHQTAFNIGIHSRLAETPNWVIEGIGTMFEAPGVWNSQFHRELSDRINQGRLDGYVRNFAQGQNRGTLKSIVESDRLFAVDPDAAYAYSWALLFYLAERETNKLSQYIKLTASRPPGQKYAPSNRLRDFVRIFGSDLTMLEQRMHRYVLSLK
jgi:hypothetical protein